MPHIHEKIDFTIEVFVVCKNKVLLRKHDKYDIWLGVGGHVELDEDPNQAAIREVKEEVGLDVELDDKLLAFRKNDNQYKELIPPRFLNRHKIDDNHEHVTLVYFAKSKNDALSVSDREVSKELNWLTMDNLEKNELGIKEDVLFYAKEALKDLGFD